MRIGIVGLPNAGKSSLFNALARAGAQAANYPFTTLEPNVAVVPVPDPRLDAVAEVLGSWPVVHETIAFHDIAGLVRGARTRARARQPVPRQHPRDGRDPARGAGARRPPRSCTPRGASTPSPILDTVETELLYADLEQAERRLERVSRQAKPRAKAVAEARWLRELVDALSRGRPARAVPAPPEAPDSLRNLQPLTAKPVLYVANVAEGNGGAPAPLAERAAREGAGVLEVSARLEAELAELEPAEAAAMRAELGAVESGLERVVRGAFELLDLGSFLRPGPARRRAPTPCPAARRRGRRRGNPHGHPAWLRARGGGGLGRAGGEGRVRGRAATPAPCAWRGATTSCATAT